MAPAIVRTEFLLGPGMRLPGVLPRVARPFPDRNSGLLIQLFESKSTWPDLKSFRNWMIHILPVRIMHSPLLRLTVQELLSIPSFHPPSLFISIIPPRTRIFHANGLRSNHSAGGVNIFNLILTLSPIVRIASPSPRACKNRNASSSGNIRQFVIPRPSPPNKHQHVFIPVWNRRSPSRNAGKNKTTEIRELL